MCSTPRAHLTPSRMGKGVSAPVHFTIHAEPRHCVIPFVRPRSPSLFTSLFLTGDADLVALRLLHTAKRDISRHVAAARSYRCSFRGLCARERRGPVRPADERSRASWQHCIVSLLLQLCFPLSLSFSLLSVFRHSARVSWAMWERVTRLDDSRNERRRVIFFPFAIENAYRPTGAFRTNTAAASGLMSRLFLRLQCELHIYYKRRCDVSISTHYFRISSHFRNRCLTIQFVILSGTG